MSTPFPSHHVQTDFGRTFTAGGDVALYWRRHATTRFFSPVTERRRRGQAGLGNAVLSSERCAGECNNNPVQAAIVQAAQDLIM